MSPYQVCVCFITRTDDGGARQVLLGRKKTGLGLGNIVGLGGKIEPGETALEAIVREIEEESSLTVEPAAVSEVGFIRYAFPHRENWSQDSTVFVVDAFSGIPMESDEVVPAWYDVTDLPLDEMWDDAKYWLPQVLAGETVHASFTFGEDLKTVSESSFDAA
ncbi:8-oxo-dGTP diphosphatase [Agreia pratensis]|uniref:8-oxo-dGTP diphosphatase n=1 Tax=Agreia pratensis TaxID=150121 RepID=UPI001889C664|nr:8-oxo-dGTP diphosphatase [Agreia pratensis]MBF4635274.1 8-oxo-dGTP diphosphatase [Agreia pratensis]